MSSGFCGLHKINPKVSESLQSLGERISLINPKARWKMTWDFIIMLLIFWNFMIISIAVCFGRPSESVFLLTDNAENAENKDSYYLFILFSFLGMIFDIFLTLNTQYYEMGVFVSERRKIFKHYLRENLVIDLIAVVSFFFQIISYHTDIEASLVKYINCLFFVKYYNIKGVFKILEEILALDDKYEAYFSLLILFIKIFCVAHLMACLWHSAAYFGRTPDDKTWLLKRNLTDETLWTERYIYSIYFALMTMTTVGYGDISAENQREALVAMIAMLVGSMMFGYSINSIGELLKKMNKKEDELKKDLTLLDRFMKSKKIEYELQARARKYLEFVWQEEKSSNNENSDEILDKLSSNIREELLLQSNGRFLLNYPMLCKNFSEKTMRRLVNVIKPVRYSPEEIIFEEGETSFNPFLYMIAHGEIELCLPIRSEDEEICRLKLLKEGESFGEISFFTELPQEYTARSLNYSTVYLIDKKDFLTIISESQEEDYEKFCMIRDKILLYQNYEELNLKCLSCNDKHTVKQCPAVLYVPSAMKIILRYQIRLRKMKSSRGKLLQARSKRKYPSLLNIKEVQKKASPLQVKDDKSLHRESIDGSTFSNFIKISAPDIFQTAKPLIEIKTSEASTLQPEQSSAKNNLLRIQPLVNRKASIAQPSIAIGALKIRKSQIRDGDLLQNTLASETKESSDSKAFKTHFQPANKLAMNDEVQIDNNISFKTQANQEVTANNNEELFMMTFDYYKNYSNYFVFNNPDSVIFKMALKFKGKSKFQAKKNRVNVIETDRGDGSPRKLKASLMKSFTTKKFFNGDL